MKVTFLTCYYEPEITPLTHLFCDLTEDLVNNNNCKVTVITPVPTKGVTKDTAAYYASNRYEEKNGGALRIIRIPIKGMENKNFISRTLRYLKISWNLYQEAKKIDTDVYFVSSTPPTFGLVAAMLNKKAPTVYNLQDMFPDSLINAGIGPKNPMVYAGRLMEKYVYKNAAKILTVTEDFKKHIIEKGIQEDKVDVVYNWIDSNVVIPIDKKDNKLIKKYSLDPESFYITYCGNIGLSQSLEMICDAAKQIANNYSDIQFIIIGNGAHRVKLEEYIKVNDIRNVMLLPFQPYEDISHVYSLGDIGIVSSKKGVGLSSFPSKTWSIMSAGRPVLASFDQTSELCSIIKEAKCGISVPPEEVQAFINAIVSLYSDKDLLKKMGKDGRKFVVKELNRKSATAAYYNTLSSAKNKANIKV